MDGVLATSLLPFVLSSLASDIGGSFDLTRTGLTDFLWSRVMHILDCIWAACTARCNDLAVSGGTFYTLPATLAVASILFALAFAWKPTSLVGVGDEGGHDDALGTGDPVFRRPATFLGHEAFETPALNMTRILRRPGRPSHRQPANTDCVGHPGARFLLRAEEADRCSEWLLDLMGEGGSSLRSSVSGFGWGMGSEDRDILLYSALVLEKPGSLDGRG